MSKLQLNSATCIIIDCISPQRANDVLKICTSKIDFGAVKLLTHADIDSPWLVKIQPLNSLVAYSVFCLTELYKYIDTDHVLIVQRDGWVLNTESWDNDWLNLDYIAPLFMQYDVVGSGGCSLRSKRIMEHASALYPTFNYTEESAWHIQRNYCGFYEDGELSMSKKFNRFKIASKEQGARFGQAGNRNPKYFIEKPFSFHRTWQDIDFNTGVVDSSDLGRDIQQSYDHEIEKLVYGS